MAEMMVLCSFLHAHTWDSSEQVLTMQTQTSGRNGSSQSLLGLLGRTLCRWITGQQSRSLKKRAPQQIINSNSIHSKKSGLDAKIIPEFTAAPGFSTLLSGVTMPRIHPHSPNWQWCKGWIGPWVFSLCSDHRNSFLSRGSLPSCRGWECPWEVPREPKEGCSCHKPGWTQVVNKCTRKKEVQS